MKNDKNTFRFTHCSSSPPNSISFESMKTRANGNGLYERHMNKIAAFALNLEQCVTNDWKVDSTDYLIGCRR